MQDSYENYVGKIIENERMRRGLAANDVCNGLCSTSVYVKLESGEYAGGIHVLRALCQRLGINSERCGSYLPQAEYDEMMDRLYILEHIRGGRLDMTEKNIAQYRAKYRNIPLNNQFILFMNGRIAELKGKPREALKFYVAALRITMPEYEGMEKFSCITIYEAYMVLDIAHLKVQLGDTEAACRMYMLLISYCENSNAEKWNLVCIYPKTVCDLIECVGLEDMGAKEKKDILRHCMQALDILRETKRLHYIRPLLKNIIKLNDNVKDIHYDTHNNSNSYCELLECLEGLFKRYGHEQELFEWYPYYVDSGFRCVNELIDERRHMHNMSIEELAGTMQSARNVQRIVRGQVSPSYKTSKELLDRLGLKGVLRSDVIVADNIETYKLWDELQGHIAKCDFEYAEKVLMQLQSKLDSSIEINHIVLEYVKIWLEMLEDKSKASDGVHKLEKLLPFKLSEIGKYKYIIKHERMVLSTYIVYMDFLKKYDSIPSFKYMTLWITEELSKKIFASIFEMLSLRYANIYGNIGNYDDSDKIAEDGIKIELECERMQSLNTLLYCIAWNDGEQKRITESSIQFCQWAYVIAKFKKSNSEMRIYEKWLKTI